MREDTEVVQFEIGDLKNFVYLILDHRARVGAIVDPQEDLTEPLGALAKQGFALERVLLTHTHFDHVAGLPRLVREFNGIPVHLHALDLHRLGSLQALGARFVPVIDGETLRLGSTAIQVLHTPGHSAGGTCYLVPGSPPKLLTGDTLFIRDCGRTDFSTGSNEEMFRSLQRLKSLSPETAIYPGHHYAPECSSTMADELRQSPPLRAGSADELAALP